MFDEDFLFWQLNKLNAIYVNDTPFKLQQFQWIFKHFAIEIAIKIQNDILNVYPKVFGEWSSYQRMRYDIRSLLCA